jgi:hypothetical protein
MFHHHNLVIFKLPRTPLLFIKHLIESWFSSVFGGLFEIEPDNELGQLSLGRRVLGFITMVLKKPKTQFWYMTTVLKICKNWNNHSKQLSVHCRLFRVFETTDRDQQFSKELGSTVLWFWSKFKTRIGGSL